ncbi:conserved hypothetical protein [Xenorhabdus bovienii str. feltiae Moldova]|uniref:Uncharacterized protein n=1 Tax=Xenorhabdus bovienii str. feltiae Moldova TaxID=1398200 RepID=A0A077NNE7_XENBV|nr:conserved hypothetical protein [Xenorhabdus bovienii str. feltiae Moldova]
MNWNPVGAYTGIQLNVVTFKNNKAQQCCSTGWASNHNIIGANAMADTQSNQTRLKFTFLIASGTLRLADMSSLIFALRQGAYHE